MDGIYLALEGKQEGPYTLDQVWQFYRKGVVSKETLAWREGMENWTTFVKMVEALPVPALSESAVFEDVPTSVTKSGFTKDQLRAIAVAQNTLMFSLLAGLAILFIERIPLIGAIAIICVGVFQIYALYELGTQMRLQLVWLYCVAMFIPIINLIILLIVSSKASRILRVAGVRIGFMGGDPNDIKN